MSRGLYPELVAKGMEHRRGDLTDPAFVTQGLAEVDAVIHTAAVPASGDRGITSIGTTNWQPT